MRQRDDRERGGSSWPGGRRLTAAGSVFAIAALAVAAVATRGPESADVETVQAAAVPERAAVVEALEDAADTRGEAAAPAEERAGSERPVGGDDPGATAAASAAAPPSDATVPPAAVGPPAGGWASASEPSPLALDPVPSSERVPKPEAVKGIYVGSWSAGSTRRLAQLVRLADRTEINAFVIDIKDATGEVSYATEVPLAKQVGADRRLRIRDVRALLDTLKAHGIYPIARVVAFKDPLLADARPEWAIQRADGSVWRDDKGVRWVDAFNSEVWAYNIELAREAIALGFAEVQWDYVRFPDAPQSYMEQAVYPARDGRTMSKGIRAFMMESREELESLGAPLTADVFGITTSAHRDVGIGQYWEDMADVIDVLLPMVYPSHYPRGTWGFPVPNAAPYQIVYKAMRHGVDRSADIPNAATIRPWIQAFDLGEPAYTPQYVRAQIDAVYDAGLTEWILWNPAARYSAEPLVTYDGRAPWFAGRGAELYQPPEPEVPDPRREDSVPIGVAADSVGGR